MRCSSALCLALCAVAVLTLPRATTAETASGSPLALPRVRGLDHPQLILAQRTISREWGPSEDSVYREVELPGWRSEGIALALSAALPGAGQRYDGEDSGRWWAAGEVLGWAVKWFEHRQSNNLRNDAFHYAGDPNDSTATWSFRRLEERTQLDDSQLRALFAADREAFYYLIGTDPRWLLGWDGNSTPQRDQFNSIRDESERHARYSRYAGTGLWLNHLAAAIDALRAARIHNLPLQRNLELKLKSGWNRGEPSFAAFIERRF